MTRAQFEQLVERHRAELRVHCYRMLGSLDESEDLLQETFLRAWRGRAGFVKARRERGCTAANRQPTVPHYLRPPEADEYRPLALDVLRVERGRIVEIVSFVEPALFKAFGLPDEFSARPR